MPMFSEALLVVVAVLYLLAAGGLLIYSANAYFLVGTAIGRWRGLRRANEVRENHGLSLLTSDAWPTVTTQIPLYNESAVARRVIEAVAAMEYPGLHEIQILDDSTDETCTIVDETAKRLESQGLRVRVVRREKRSGYKAGALAKATSTARGEFIAIFDADFVPPPDFLRRTIPHLVADSRIAWVQARWGHLNENFSLLTRAQGLGIDGHFAIDQGARCGSEQLLMNFNGSAGVWRREAIKDAGGWTADTLTEDLDLSFRAQLRGWRGVYLPELVAPAELPGNVAAFKSQQFRWAKGSIQTAIKLSPALWRSDLPFAAKVQGWFHLTHYAIHPLIVLLALLSGIVPWIMPKGLERLDWLWLPIAVLSVGPSLFSAAGQALLYQAWPKRLLRLPLLVLAGVGLALSNSVAVLEGLFRKPSAFIRTPKQGNLARPSYQAKVQVPALAEACGALCCLSMFVWAAAEGKAMSAQFLLLVGAGFSFVAGSGWFGEIRIRETPPLQRPAPPEAVAPRVS